MESLPAERISLSNISNKPISSPLHLGMTEKSLFTEVIIFENNRIRIRTSIFHLGRGRMNALPLSYTASNYTVVRKSYEKKVFFSETRRELPFGFEPKTCWFVINCSIHLSYDSINAVWRIRTSKSFPTDRLATGSNTITGIRHAMAQFLDTQLTNSTLRLPEGVVPSKWSWWSEIRTLQTYRNRFTVGLLFQLHIHQCQKCVFTELSLLIKQVPWFFMCIPTTALTFGYSLWLSASPQRYWVDFHF